jgi:POT family proton-dependent oligopeptide transporter
MQTPTSTSGSAPRPAGDRAFFGHPRGLSTLFFTELWERFSYYGMRGLLVLFMTTGAAQGGMEWDPKRAAAIYGIYTSLVYLLALPGGWVADKILGQQRAVLYGGIVIMLGHISLAMHGLSFFYGGMALIVIGTGLLKPNISAMVGQLYAPEDQRRDAGFSIFYMGINIGAALAPIVCGWLAEDQSFRAQLADWGFNPAHSWHWGFGAAAVGMAFGLVQYVRGSRHLSEESRRPAPAANAAEARKRLLIFWGSLGACALVAGGMGLAHKAGTYELTVERVDQLVGGSLFVAAGLFFAWMFLAGQWTKEERKRLIVISVLFGSAIVFWSVFEQAGSTLNLFANDTTDRSVEWIQVENAQTGVEEAWTIPAAAFQSLNAIFIVLLAPLFAWLWIRLGKRDPSSPAKFTIGILFAALGFAVLAGGAMAAEGGAKVSPMWLISVYLLHTIGELCLSPVGLSSMTKLAPARIVGMMMGVWFLSTSIGYWVGGQIAQLYEKAGAEPAAGIEPVTLYSYVTLYALAACVVMALLIVPIRRMMQRAN